MRAGDGRVFDDRDRRVGRPDDKIEPFGARAGLRVRRGRNRHRDQGQKAKDFRHMLVFHWSTHKML
jgi:hypothetical protein